MIVASHTEITHFSPAALMDFGMALAMEGFDVDLIPYGQTLTSTDIETADMVVVLPVADYPPAAFGEAPYDEAWTEAEIEVLVDYVAQGGQLVLTNSAHRLKYGNRPLDPNEDFIDMNALAARFDITYLEGSIPGGSIDIEEAHSLMTGVTRLETAAHNGIPFTMLEGEVVARAGGDSLIGIVEYGELGGRVIVLADLSLLASGYAGPTNHAFWTALAAYVIND